MGKLFLHVALLLGMACSNAALAQSGPYPIDIDIWTPPYNNTRQRSQGQYTPYDKASKEWKICVCIPHLNDAYWLGVNYSLIDEAKRLGVAVNLFEAGGYGHLEQQRAQVQQCLDSGADGLILSAMRYDGFTDLIERYAANGRPVIDLLNGVAPKGLSARIGASYWDSGYLVGNYLVAMQKKESKPLRVAWFPGPLGTWWGSAADKGFKNALAGSSVKIVTTRHGDTGRETQAKLIREALAAFPNIDYIVGTAVAAKVAIQVLRKKGLTKTIKVLPYYYDPGVHKGIARGIFQTAPSDMQGFQARLAVDTIVRILEGADYHVHFGARVQMINRASLQDFDESSSLPPSGFRPIFNYGNW